MNLDLDLFIFILYVGVFLCMHMCAHSCLGPEDVRRGHWVPRSGVIAIVSGYVGAGN